MAAFSDGAIVGSAIVRIVAEHGADCVPYVKEYVQKHKRPDNIKDGAEQMQIGVLKKFS